MNKVELMRALLEMRSPHPHLAHGFRGKIGTVDDVGTADTEDLRTKNGSFSQSIVTDDKTGLLVRMWWSYSTCIVREHVQTGLAVRSTYRYSNTTTRHQQAVRLTSHFLALWLPMCLSDGVKPVDAVQKLVDAVQAAKLKLVRSRGQWKWCVVSVQSRVHDLTEMCDAIGEPIVLPPFQEGLTDKQYAKVLGVALNDVSTANMLAIYNKFVKENDND